MCSFNKVKFLLIFIFLINFDLISKDITYLFPHSGTSYHQPNTEIIIKFDENISLNNINKKNIYLTGNKSGNHNFELVLSSDKQTLILKPYNNFAIGEKVDLKINDNFFKNEKFQTFNSSFEIVNKFISDNNILSNSNNDYEITDYITKLDEKVEKDYFIDYNQAKLNGELPADFPTLEIKINNNPKDGFMLVAPRVEAKSGFGNYLIILDKNGVPVKYRPTTPNSFNFKQQANGRYIVAETAGSHYGITGNGTKATIRIFDNELNLLESFQMGNGYTAGPHEFIIQPNGNYICVAQNPIPMDMSKVVEGGNPNAFIVSNVIQEFDREKNVIFQWRAIDHIEINESYLKLTDPVISYAHINALEVDRDGNWLISPRHTAAIMKINRGTGAIMWRLGGKKSDFTVIGDEKNGPEYFCYQHDIRKLNNGDITMFDNGNLKTPQYSRGVRYSLDEVNKTATLVWQYRNSPDVYAGQQGSVQTFDDGSYLIGWGTATAANQIGLTELDRFGNKTFELNFPPNTSHYRVQKVAYPSCPPVAEVFKEELLEENTYNFNETDKNTGIKITYTTLNSPVPYNNFTVKKYDCAPLDPEFMGLTPSLIAHRVEILTTQIDNFVGEVELDMTYYQNSLDLSSPVVFFRNTVGSGLFQSVQSQFNATTKILKFQISSTGEIAIGKASNQTQVPVTTLFLPTNNELVDYDNDVRLEWTNNTNYFGNQVYLYEHDGSGNKTEITNTNVRNLYYDIPKGTLKNNTKYSWKILPNYVGIGNETEEWVFETKEKFINVLAPNGGENVSNNNGKFIVRWEDNFMDTVRVELLKADNPYKSIKDTVVSYTNNFLWNVANDIEKGTDYKIKLSSFNNNITSISESNFNIDDFSSVENMVESIDFEVYPNPAENIINFNYENLKSVNNTNINTNFNKYEIVNNNGIVIANDKLDITDISVNVSNLNTGIYLLKLFNQENQYIVTKFIKK